MTQILYLQRRVDGKWANHAKTETLPGDLNSTGARNRLQASMDNFDAQLGKRRPWRIIEITADGSDRVIWENDAARLFNDAVTANARRAANFKAKPLDEWELLQCRTASSFKLASKDGRNVAMRETPTYLEALALRDQLGSPADTLIYAITPAGRHVLVTQRLHTQLTAST